jgi:PAS domain S-box-containing protein
MHSFEKEIDVLRSRVAELEHELEQYRSVQRAGWTPHLFYLASLTSDGVVVYVSQSFSDIWGRDRGELACWPGDWLATVHPDDYERVAAAFRGFHREQFRNPRPKLQQEYRIIRPDGSVRWIRDRVYAVSGWSGESRWLVGMARDVTDQEDQSTRS